MVNIDGQFRHSCDIDGKMMVNTVFFGHFFPEDADL